MYVRKNLIKTCAGTYSYNNTKIINKRNSPKYLQKNCNKYF